MRKPTSGLCRGFLWTRLLWVRSLCYLLFWSLLRCFWTSVLAALVQKSVMNCKNGSEKHVGWKCRLWAGISLILCLLHITRAHECKATMTEQERSLESFLAVWWLKSEGKIKMKQKSELTTKNTWCFPSLIVIRVSENSSPTALGWPMHVGYREGNTFRWLFGKLSQGVFTGRAVEPCALTACVLHQWGFSKRFP